MYIAIEFYFFVISQCYQPTKVRFKQNFLSLWKLLKHETKMNSKIYCRTTGIFFFFFIVLINIVIGQIELTLEKNMVFLRIM